MKDADDHRLALGRSNPVPSGVGITIASRLQAFKRSSLKARFIAEATMNNLIANENRTNQRPLVTIDPETGE